ncbi:hypothetical protein B0T16DRAFT_186956 [Cercophora newfieldiana]|uniref:Uncharacterized protein n=1 Tax=Cercophora newfieldiana TaxID=92897 RepID=A0AA40CM68_9PEZI|nr:hypothetical protein B0T16DRAFT_186956 [Cercophora newfieldiana]
MGFEGYSDHCPWWISSRPATCRPCSPDWAERAWTMPSPSNFTQSRRQQKRACWRRPRHGRLPSLVVTPAATATHHILRLPCLFNTSRPALGSGEGRNKGQNFYPSFSPAAPPSSTRLVHLLACILLDPHPSPRDPPVGPLPPMVQALSQCAQVPLPFIFPQRAAASPLQDSVADPLLELFFPFWNLFRRRPFPGFRILFESAQEVSLSPFSADQHSHPARLARSHLPDMIS